MGLYGDVDGAKVTPGGVYFAVGDYVVKVCACKSVRSSKSGEDLFIVECEVLESSVELLPPGSKVSQTIKVKQIMGPPNIKAFIAAATGIDPVAETMHADVLAEWDKIAPDNAPWSFEHICEYAVSDANPFEDIDLDLACRPTTTKAGNPFTLHFWSPRG